MKTLDLIQGSPEWHAHRASHFNASDAPAMMNCSPYETRQQLIHRLKTGIGKEVDAATQKRFDDGHRFEALARPLAETIIGEKLYPVTGSEGELSASFDGLTMAEDVGFEHKSLNNELRDALPAMGLNEGVTLPLLFRVQMEQQCMVAGCERELFMASKWEGEPGNERLVEERHCWYESNQHLADDIADGWRQLAVDLAAYVPAAAAPVTLTAKTRESLPALLIEAKGEITESNLAEFKAHAIEAIEGINTTLETDQDFVDADADGKWCREVAANMKQFRAIIQGKMGSVDEAMRALDHLEKIANSKALDLEKLVKSRKDEIREEVVAGGVSGLRTHIAALNARLGRPLMPAVPADFGGAVKNKRTLESLNNAVNSELARATIAASRIADQIDANLKTLAAAEPATLFPDVQALVLKAPDDLAAVIAHRIAEHEKTIQAAKDKEAAAAIAPAPAPAVIQMPTRAALPATAPSLRLGVINTRLAPVQITADGLSSLGFKGVKDRGAVLYHEADFAHICAALVAHVQSIQAKQAA
jgi:predicted phage-related endonuclease